MVGMAGTSPAMTSFVAETKAKEATGLAGRALSAVLHGVPEE
jgi:hypothetical protein